MAHQEPRHPAAHAHASSALAPDAHSSAICVGDMISLFVEDLNGFVSADGFTEDSLNVTCLRSDEICVPRFESCVFQVQVKQNYHAKVELETFLEQNGVVDASRADEELTVKLYQRFLNLCAKVKEEERHNAEDAHIYFGRELRHSVPMQLLHVKSQKYVKVCLDNAADAEGSNIAVILTNAGAASCFRFRSCHNLKLDDEPVCNLDTVYVVPEDLADSHYLNCDVDLARLMHSFPRKMKHRVSALLTGMTCMVQTYSHVSAPRPLRLDNAFEDQKLVPIHCGQVVRLFHRRLDVFLATSPSMVSSNSLIVLEDANGFFQPGAAVRLEQPSAYSMWIVESANPTEGPIMMYDQPIRLRNLATDGYLCPNKVNTAVMAKQIYSWSANGPSKRTIASSICCFSRLKENRTDDASIGKRSSVWINFPSADEGDGMFLCTSGSVTSPSLELDSELGPTDGFFLHPVGDEDLTAPWQIVSVSHTLRDYIMLLKQRGFCPETAVQTERIIKILRNLMAIFDKSAKVKSNDNGGEAMTEDIENSEKIKSIEREIYKSQSIIRELQLMDDLVQLVDFQAWGDIEKARERGKERAAHDQARDDKSQSHVDPSGREPAANPPFNNLCPPNNSLKHSIHNLRHSMDMSLARELCDVVFQILSLATRGHDRNGVHLSQSIDSLLFHFTGYVGSGPANEGEVRYLSSLQRCILDIYRDNSLVLSSLDSASISFFVNLLSSQQRLTPTYVRFLGALIEHKQKAVIHSVRLLCDLLLAEHVRDCVPKTTMRGVDILVLMPSFGSFASWVPLEQMLRNPLEAEYYNEFINLASIMCCGRTKTNEVILNRLIDSSFFNMDLCVCILLRESLPYSTRAVFARLLREAFIDCHPQQVRCYVDNLQVWSDLYTKPVLANAPFPSKYGGIIQPLRIKNLALEFLETNDVQGFDAEKDAFGLALVELLHHLVYYGFFNHTIEWVLKHEFIGEFPRYKGRIEALLRYLDRAGDGSPDGPLARQSIEVEILVQPIVLMLDPSTDNKRDSKKQSATLIKTKMMICTILDLICRIRLRVRANRLLQVYDADLQNGLVFGHVHKERSALEEGAMLLAPLKLDARRPDFEQVLSLIAFDNQALTKILGDLLQYGDETLDNRALKMMLRVYEQRHELVETMQRTELLVNHAVINSYFEHMAIMKDLEDLVLTLGLIVDEVINRREEERLEKLLREQQSILKDDEDEDEEGDVAGGEGNFFSSMPSFKLDVLAGGITGLAEGLSGIAHVGDGLSQGISNFGNELAEGIPADFGFGGMFGGAVEKKKTNHRMSVSMMARMSRKHDTQRTNDKKGGARAVKKLKSKTQSEEAEVEEETDINKVKLVTSLHREKLDADKDLVLVLQDNCEQIRRRISHIVNDCSLGIVKLPLIKLQHGLKDLHAHVRVLEIVRSIHVDPTLLDNPAVFELLRQSCSLLTWFVKNNVVNAALINTEIDVLLKLLDHPRALDFGIDEVICSLYNNNRTLCTQASDKVEKRAMTLICGAGQRYPYLKLLMVLMAPNHVSIKRNQARILKMLTVQSEKSLCLFDGEEGLEQLKTLVRQRDHVPRDTATEANNPSVQLPVRSRPSEKGKRALEKETKPGGKDSQQMLYDPVLNKVPKYDSQVLYYLYTIKLFTQACLGSNHLTERACCKLLPLSRCAEIIAASWPIAELKIAVLEFAIEAHLIREKARPEHCSKCAHDENLWVMMSYFGSMLHMIMDPNEKKSYCSPKERLAHTTEITGLFLGLGKVFFSYFRIRNASEHELKIGNMLCDAMVKFWGEHSKIQSELRALADMLYVMERNGIKGNESTKRLLKTLLEADRINLVEKTEAEGNESWYTKESALFPSFVDTFQTRIHVETEIKELITVCRHHERSVKVITAQLTSNRVDVSQKRKYIVLLQTLWETLTDSNMRIDTCIEKIRLDVVISALLQLVSKDTEVKACLELAVSLLTRGGTPVQRRFLTILGKRGPAEAFLRQLATLIEIAVEEAREMRAILGQVVLNSKPEHGARYTLEQLFQIYNSNDDDEGQNADLEGVVDDSHICQVLMFVKNLTEGHFFEMQNLMRKQHYDFSVDLVSAVALFTIECAESVSPLNIDLVTQGFETLTEFMQGPNNGNIFAVLKTNIVDTINSIMVKSHADLEGVFYPQQYLNKVRDMKSMVMTSMLAMMEASSGSELKVPITLMDSLNLGAVLDYAIGMHRQWDLSLKRQQKAGLHANDPVLAKLNAVTLSAGFKCYVLLRSLADFDSVSFGSNTAPLVFEKLRDTSIDAIWYYAQQVGCLEIARETRMKTTEIIRVYFEVPVICNRITRQMKQDILWSVDRTNDVTRLHDFFSRVDDLYFDMKYQEWISSNSLTVLMRQIGDYADALYLGNVILINLLLLVYFRWREPLESDPDATWEEMRHVDLNGAAKVALESILPSVQLVLEFIMVMNYSISRVPIFVRKQFKQEHLDKDKVDSEGHKIPFEYDKIPRNFHFFRKYCLFLLRDNNFYSGQCFMWRIFTWSLAMAINLFSVLSSGSINSLALLFYFVLLWEVFPRSKQIGFVIKAVIMGGAQLLALFGMLLVFTYWFGVVGFVAFPDKFQFRRAEVVDGSTVQNSVEAGFGNNRAVPLQYVWQGIIMVIDQGVRKDDVGEALDKFNWPVPCPNPAEYGCEPCPGSPWVPRNFDCILDRYPPGVSDLMPDGGSAPCLDPGWLAKLDGYLEIKDCADVATAWPQAKIFIRMVYTFLFFVFVSAIGLEIVFGVIVDSFKSLREDREETLKDIKYKCFICGINRDVFDARMIDSTAGKTGFDKHTDDDHNMWTYMYFLIHIREIEDKTELNGVESYVHEKAIRNDVSFFPITRSMRLDVLGGLKDVAKEAFLRKIASVEAVERRSQWLMTSVSSKVNALLIACGLAGRLKTDSAASAQLALQEPIELCTPLAVREVSKRIKIRRTYSPLQTFVIPALTQAQQMPARESVLGLDSARAAAESHRSDRTPRRSPRAMARQRLVDPTPRSDDE